MIKKLAYIFLTVVVANGALISQNCDIKITGSVFDQGSNERLEYSTIAIEETNDYVVTDSLGSFSINNLCPGSYHVQVFHIGCPSKQYFLEIQKDTHFNFYLDHHGELLKEVVVKGAPNSFQQSKTQQSISASAIRDQAGSSLADMTENITGVRTLKNGSGITKPIIHGLYGNRISVVNNGLLQAGQQWGADHAPEIDPNSANRITVVKGSDAIEYGSSALGGAVLVDMGSIKLDPHIHGFLSYGYATNGRRHALTGMVNQFKGKFGWRLSGTLKKSGDHQTPDYYLTNTGYDELNGAIQMVYQPSAGMEHELYYSLFTTTLGVFAGSTIGNLTDLEEAIGRDVPFNINDYFSYQVNPPSQKVEHHLLKYAGKKMVDSKTYYEWVFGSQYDHRREFDWRRGGRSDIPTLELKLLTQDLKFKFVRDNGRIRYKVGGQFAYSDNTNDAETGILPLIPDYLRATLGLYGISQYAIGRFEIEGGARYDIQHLTAWPITLTLPREIEKMEHLYHNYAFSLGGLYQAGNESTSRLQLALAKRSPEVNELYSNGLHQGVASIEEGNWDLQSEVSFKAIFTQGVHFENLFHVDLSVYSHWFDGYIYLKPEDELRLTIRGAFPVYKYTQEDAWIRGCDLVLVSDFSHQLEWNAKFSWLRGTSFPDNQPLSLMPSTEISSALSWSLKDSPTFRGTRLSVEGSFTAKQKHWDEEAELLAPPEGYFLLGFKFGTDLIIKNQSLHIGCSVHNALNTQYRDYLNRLRYFSDEQGIDIRFNVRYNF